MSSLDDFFLACISGKFDRPHVCARDRKSVLENGDDEPQANLETRTWLATTGAVRCGFMKQVAEKMAIPTDAM